MKKISISDIENLKIIHKFYKNLKKKNLESISNMIITLYDQKYIIADSEISKIVFFIFLFIDESIFNYVYITNIVNIIIEKIYILDCKINNNLKLLNIIINKFIIELYNFFIDYEDNYFNKLTNIKYDLYRLKNNLYTKYEKDNYLNVINYIDGLNNDINKTFIINNKQYYLDYNYNLLILKDEILNNLENILDIINSNYFTVVFDNFSYNLSENITDFLILINHRYYTEVGKKFNYDNSADQIIDNNDLLLNLIYKISLIYESILKNTFTNFIESNFFYPFILKLILDPLILQNFKNNNNQIVSLSFSILYIIYNYFLLEN